MAEGALLEPDDTAWAEALVRIRHDIYHLPDYARLDADLVGGTATAFRYDEADHVLLLPLILRPIPETGLHDAVSPYGYPGPVSDVAPVNSGFWARAARALVALLNTHGVVTAFVRLHPLLPAPQVSLQQTGTLVNHGQTVSIDLTGTAEQLWRDTHRTHRKQISRAKRAEVAVVFDDWDTFDTWIDTYHATMHRVGARDFYFFSHEHLHRLRDALGPHLHLATAVRRGEVLGGNLFFEYDGMMHTHLQATRDGEIFYADKLLYHEVRLWGRQRGNRVVHLGGGVGGADDSLFQYKAAFGGGRQDFHTWRLITDPAAYERLAGAPTAESLGGRFPPYR
ncbi:GNAT family N-acetyltransferase [Actinoplanes oblitus]|uniref:GNAT family N-acetyltransferase n=1 Tax=Actinoplanes oblitus TaxID=3040509 RepID=A0ABY8WBA9_9ACTN|nr:GNAT family N-acetyltransferase [Actinoplanes oblitus]WIM94227.1 GNAT family N-acetyltransferase [Actinoplanes oblitus]